jgi:hypothetical protein
MNDICLIKIFDQRFDLYAMQLCLSLNPMAFQLFLSYPSTLFDPMTDGYSDNRELNLSAYPVLPLNFNPKADGNFDIRIFKPFNLSCPSTKK